MLFVSKDDRSCVDLILVKNNNFEKKAIKPFSHAYVEAEKGLLKNSYYCPLELLEIAFSTLNLDAYNYEVYFQILGAVDEQNIADHNNNLFKKVRAYLQSKSIYIDQLKMCLDAETYMILRNDEDVLRLTTTKQKLNEPLHQIQAQ